MKNQRKKINVLLVSCLLLGAATIYFGIKTNQLSNTLLKQNSSITNELDNSIGRDIAKIDSLLFKGEYKEVLKISEELKLSKTFENDSILQSRYNLASGMLEVKSLKNKKTIKSVKVPNTTNKNKKLEKNNDSISKKLVNTEKKLAMLTNKLNTTGITNSKYLTFKTTKGTELHYIGDIKNNQANGYGVAILKSGSRYEGDWYNNKRHGIGQFFWDDGDYYEGAYKDDKREGLGMYHWKNGDKYHGEWKNDKRNGKGKFYNKKGKLKASGIWKDDVLLTQDKKEK